MTELTISFKIDPLPSNLEYLTIPVEVRKPNMVLVASGLNPMTINVEPGKYIVKANLPGGQEVCKRILVGSGKPYQYVKLSPKPTKRPISGSSAFEYYFKGITSVKPDEKTPRTTGTGNTLRARLRAFQGNPMKKGAYTELKTWDMKVDSTNEPNLITIPWQGDNQPAWVQLLQPDRVTLNVLLPASQSHGCSINLRKTPDGNLFLDIDMENSLANNLLQYYNNGQLSQTSLLANEQGTSSEELLLYKEEDPVAAAVGAYMLLQMGSLERMHDWAQNLYRKFPWIPDGAIILGEYLARMGNHKEALEKFLELPERGLPIFSFGLSNTIDRLRLYFETTQLDISSLLREHIREKLSILQRFATYTDFQNVLTTFTGFNPEQPDNKTLEDNLNNLDGEDLSSYQLSASTNRRFSSSSY